MATGTPRLAETGPPNSINSTPARNKAKVPHVGNSLPDQSIFIAIIVGLRPKRYFKSWSKANTSATMCLINTETLNTKEFSGPDIPKYAILSHIWVMMSQPCNSRRPSGVGRSRNSSPRNLKSFSTRTGHAWVPGRLLREMFAKAAGIDGGDLKQATWRSTEGWDSRTEPTVATKMSTQASLPLTIRGATES